MKLPIIDKCCCCLSLRTGLLIFGGLNAASAVLALIITIASLEELDSKIRETTVYIIEKQNETVVKEVDVSQFNLEGYEVSIIFFGLRLMLSVILIVGAKKRDVVFLNIYIVFQIIQMALLCVWLLVEILSLPSSVTLFRFIDLGFQIYIYLIIRSLVLEVQTTQIQEYDEKNLNAFRNTEVN